MHKRNMKKPFNFNLSCAQSDDPETHSACDSVSPETKTNTFIDRSNCVPSISTMNSASADASSSKNKSSLISGRLNQGQPRIRTAKGLILEHIGTVNLRIREDDEGQQKGHPQERSRILPGFYFIWINFPGLFTKLESARTLVRTSLNNVWLHAILTHIVPRGSVTTRLSNCEEPSCKSTMAKHNVLHWLVQLESIAQFSQKLFTESSSGGVGKNKRD